MKSAKKLNFLITAGPTREPIDPVRFISNYSTGTLGYKIAEKAALKKFNVTLISGPTCINPPEKVKYISIETANEMLSVLKKEVNKADVLIMSAAVSDFRPVRKESSKLKKEKNKKNEGNLELKLKKTPDILKSMAEYKKGKLFIGFCLETSDLENNAKKKLKDKNLDYIVGFLKTAVNNPFGDTVSNAVIIDKSLKINTLRRVSKDELAARLIDIGQKVCYTF